MQKGLINRLGTSIGVLAVSAALLGGCASTKRFQNPINLEPSVSNMDYCIKTTQGALGGLGYKSEVVARTPDKARISAMHERKLSTLQAYEYSGVQGRLVDNVQVDINTDGITDNYRVQCERTKIFSATDKSPEHRETGRHKPEETVILSRIGHAYQTKK